MTDFGSTGALATSGSCLVSAGYDLDRGNGYLNGKSFIWKNNLFWMVTHLALITGRYLTAKFRSTMLISVYVPSVGKLREYFLTWLTCLYWFSPQHSFWGIPSNRRWRMHGKYHLSVMHTDNTWAGDGAENVYRRAGAETLGSATKFKSQEAFKVSLTC